MSSVGSSPQDQAVMAEDDVHDVIENVNSLVIRLGARMYHQVLRPIVLIHELQGS